MKNFQKINVQELLRNVRTNLESQYEAAEARALSLLLFDHFLGMDAKAIIVNPETAVSAESLLELDVALKRLLRHEPVQYITGIAHFCGHEFEVSPSVLIPRPETEELVRWVLQDVADKRNMQIADIGTGSGCIAISLALRLDDASVVGYDFSAEALHSANKNKESLNADVSFVEADFLNPASWPMQKFDIIVSNPPYIPAGNKTLLPRNVAEYEPASALFVPDDDPLIFYNAIAAFAMNRLNTGGSVYVEIHEDFAVEVQGLFTNHGFIDVILRHDLNGKARMIKASIA
jgi:release factor glutamine methyltransferase